MPKEFAANFEPWDYEPSQVRVLCGECYREVRQRCKEFSWFCDKLPGAALGFLLDGLATFRDLIKDHSVQSEDIYCCLKGSWKPSELSQDRPSYKVTKNEIRNFLMGQPTGTLYPIIDGLEALQGLTPDEQISRASGLRKVLQTHAAVRTAMRNAEVRRG